MIQNRENNFIVSFLRPKFHFQMREEEISVNLKENATLAEKKLKIVCIKCGGSGNLQTPEHSRRTCLICFGKGYTN